jgi:hypothetical protein
MVYDLKWLTIGSFLFFSVLDLFVSAHALQRGIDAKNRYYVFQKRYGARRTAMLKIAFVALMAPFFLSPPVYAADFLWLAVILYFEVVRLVIAVWRAARDRLQPSEPSKANPMDGIVGLLVYPLDYLDAGKPFFSGPPAGVKWSWGAFVLPEYWYFTNEILGAGYLSWLLLFPYVLLLLSVGSKAFIVILLIRLASGLFGQRLYFARYGRFA